MFCATVTKPTAASPLGLRLWSPPTDDVVLLVQMDDHGLLANKLKIGLQIESINGRGCAGMTAQQVQAHLDRLVGKVTIWASAAPPQPYGRRAVAVVSTKSADAYDTTPKSIDAKSLSPPPGITALDDDDDDEDSSLDSLSLDSISLHDDANKTTNESSNDDMMDYDYYYAEDNYKACRPTAHRVGPLFDAVVDFFLF